MRFLSRGTTGCPFFVGAAYIQRNLGQSQTRARLSPRPTAEVKHYRGRPMRLLGTCSGTLLARIEALFDDPRPPGCKNLSRRQKRRLCQGSYCFLYKTSDAESLVEVCKLGA